MEEQIEKRACKNCIHYQMCVDTFRKAKQDGDILLIEEEAYFADANGCDFYADKRIYRKHRERYLVKESGDIVPLTPAHNDHLEYISDLLTEFDEFGYVPGVPVPDPEAFAIKWRDNITKAIEELSKQSEWISVSERLPEEGKNVLCYDHGKVLIAFLDDKYTGVWWDYVAYDRDDTWDEVFPTHWMPLPQAPKMKGGAE